MLERFIFRNAYRWLAIASALVAVTSCSHQQMTSSLPSFFYVTDEPKLISIHLVDRNGLSETISNPDRLSDYADVNFTKPQPYKKILRVFERDCCGNTRSIITSYYENGQIQKYLEVNNNRALGCYREWFENSALHVEANVIGGMPDITPAGEKSWLFDGEAYAWDECGNLAAVINYYKGKLEGDSLYYHTNGTVWKRSPFRDGNQQGVFEVFYKDGALLQTITYNNDLKDGPAKRYWHSGELAAEERYRCGKLLEGKYYDLCGKCVSEVCNGEGQRAIFSETNVRELQTYVNGVQEGGVRLFDDNGTLVKTWVIRKGEKHGKEIEYYPTPGIDDQARPKLEVMWYEGKIQGMVRSWYSNGVQENKREMSNNNKNGLLSAFYRDGSLMMVEEYEDDKLIKGEYYPRGERVPISEVENGEGIVTFYDPDGGFVRKVNYRLGKPCE